jgi:hypothetical protein
MKGIEIRNGCVFYYGNPAGYIDKETAVLDNLFRSGESESWIAKRGLIPQWSDGVYDRLMSGGSVQTGEAPTLLKSCRIRQLKPDVDVTMKFIDYAEMTTKFGGPCPENYNIVYDGHIETNDPEAIWTKFNDSRPPGYTGYPLSMSDVVELYDDGGSEFHYVDRFGFRQIDFEGRREQAQGITMSM